MTKVSNRHLETRRDQILDAAISCFARSGFIGTTIEDICKEARLSHGLVYRYFCSKQDIIEASIKRYHKDRAMRVTGGASIETLSQDLEDITNIQTQKLLTEEPEHDVRVMLQSFVEALNNPKVKKIVSENWEDITDRNEAIIRKAQDLGQINSELAPRAVATLLNAMYYGLVLQRAILPDSSVDMRKVLQAVRALFVTGEFWTSKSELCRKRDSWERDHDSETEGDIATEHRVRCHEGSES